MHIGAQIVQQIRIQAGVCDRLFGKPLASLKQDLQEEVSGSLEA
jgi:hypothetical protein